MNRNRLTPVIYIIILLALLSLVSPILTNPSLFIRNTLVFSSICGLVVGLIYFLFYRRRPEHNELKKYRKAAKKSKKRQAFNHNTFAKTKQKKRNQHSRRNSINVPHLRVIDGKKATKPTNKKDEISL